MTTKRRRMVTQLIAQDFKYEKDAHEFCDPANDFESVEVAVDADLEPAEPSIGYRGGVDLWDDIETELGKHVPLKLLTDEARERLEDEYNTWSYDQSRREFECARDAWVDAKIDEWKERRRERV